MKDRIITQSIESLKLEGLKFSVDTIAEKLNVSKKTIYKYFPDKQTLAIAIFERFYLNVNADVEKLKGDRSESARFKLLSLYFDAKQMTSGEIFNKYKLNEALRTYTQEQNDRLFKTVYSTLCDGAECDESTVRTIIDGTFEKLCSQKASAENVINYLVKALKW
ncbi:MAG: TetR/AcrR family transcriptional regulator [Candidatus Coproplasma sp.]